VQSPVTPLFAASRVALVHDFLLDLRGAERVFLELCAVWPQADVFTAVYDEEGTRGQFSDHAVTTSFLQKLRPTARTFRALLPLYPTAIESLDLSGYDLVISSSSAWAHAVRCAEHAVHVCYCHNPFRYVWNEREQTLARRGRLTRVALRSLFAWWRRWDWVAAQKTDRYIANAELARERIREYFGREATVIHPPVHVERFSPGPVRDHYAIVAELMPHKQIDVAVEAFNRLRRPLLVVGDGPAYRRLRRSAGPTVSFTGRVPDAEVASLLQSARALVITSVEEFGITSVEAQAAGRPVIARRAGGALETVVDGVTGRFWSGGPGELTAAVAAFDETEINSRACVANAARFAPPRFRAEIQAEVMDARAGRDRLAAVRQGTDASSLLAS
jgi:glycosyltransferase involved in cell wall biosynthesis